MTSIATALEYKSENDIETKEGDTSAVEAAVATLQSTFETKIGELTTQVKAANDNASSAKARADALEIKIARPAIITKDSKEPTAETKAFTTFIRRGKEALGAEEFKDLRVSDDTAGGYLAPEQFVAELDRNVVLFSPVRQVASVRNTMSGSVLMPKRTGGMTAAWTGETAARTETNVTFGQTRYTVYELAAYVDVSNVMLEDSALDVPSLLAFEFAEEFGKAEGTAFCVGQNVSNPAGFLNDANIGNTVSGHATAVTADGLIDLYHALASPYRANAVWGMNSTTMAAVRKLKDGNGNYLVTVSGLAGAVASTILGRPIVEMPDLPDVGAGAYPIVFGDFSSGYRIFDRVSLSVLRDPYSQATNGLTRFHGRRRVAGGVGKSEALRKLRISAS